MLHRLRHRLGYLVLLLLFVPGLVITSAGEARSHGPLSTAAVDSAHQETERNSHAHDHGHEHGEGHSPHHESGSHFHETAARPATGVTFEPLFRAVLRSGDRDGVPLHRVYRLERPPRPVIAV